MKSDRTSLMQHHDNQHRGRILGVLGLLVLLAAPIADAQATECLQQRLRPYTDLIQPVSPEQMERTHPVGSQMTPPLNPGVGDSWDWYIWNLGGFPVAELKSCTVRGEGTNVYIVIEDSQWLTNVDQADVDAMVERWDNSSLGNWPDKGIYQLNNENFGPVPDQLDNDPKVYVLYYDFVISADGFFWAFDMYPDGSQSFASNETEVLYMNSSDNDPGGDYLISVQAHEFEHMIHWLADENETAWVDEGCAELAMWLFGHPDPVISFPNNPDNNLTEWNSVFADYVKTYLWTLYLYEHFGGQATILALVAHPSNSNFGVQAVLTAQGYTETFADVVADWTTANFIDDPGIDGGKFNYVGEDLPNFSAVQWSSYPVPPTNAAVQHYAAEYVRLINGEPQRLHFDGTDTVDWAARVIRYTGGVPVSVEEIPLDAVGSGYLDLPGFGGLYDQVVLVVANISTGAGSKLYTYSTEMQPAAVASHLTGFDGLRLETAGANPFASGTRVRLTVNTPTWIDVSVHDVLGREIRGLQLGPVSAGENTFDWDGKDETGSPVEGGVYFILATAPDGRTASQRVILIR